MKRCLRFLLSPEVPLDEVEDTLQLAMFAVEGLVGRIRVRTECDHDMNHLDRVIVIDDCSVVGWLVSRIFAGLLSREFGEHSFRLERGDLADSPKGKPTAKEACV
jgi:hypothetical protein